MLKHKLNRLKVSLSIFSHSLVGCLPGIIVNLVFFPCYSWVAWYFAPICLPHRKLLQIQNLPIGQVIQNIIITRDCVTFISQHHLITINLDSNSINYTGHLSCDSELFSLHLLNTGLNGKVWKMMNAAICWIFQFRRIQINVNNDVLVSVLVVDSVFIWRTWFLLSAKRTQ